MKEKVRSYLSSRTLTAMRSSSAHSRYQPLTLPPLISSPPHPHPHPPPPPQLRVMCLHRVRANRDRLLWDMRASASPSASVHVPLASYSAIHSPLSPSSLSLSKPQSRTSTSSLSYSHSLSHSHSPSSLSQPAVSSAPSPSSLAALHPLLSVQPHPTTSAALVCMGAQQPGGAGRAESCWQADARVRSEGGERDGGMERGEEGERGREGESDGGVRDGERMEGVAMAMGERWAGEGHAGSGGVSAGRNEGSRGAQVDLAHGMGAEGRGARPELRRVLFGELQRLRGGCDDVSRDGGGGGMGHATALEHETELHNAVAGRGEHKVWAWEHEWSSCDPMHYGGDGAGEVGGGARGRGEWDSDEEAGGRWEDADGVLQLNAEEYEALLLDMQRALYEDDDDAHADDAQPPPLPSGM
ncbi:unnamed protein product [Closterium sp. NIES-53]